MNPLKRLKALVSRTHSQPQRVFDWLEILKDAGPAGLTHREAARLLHEDLEVVRMSLSRFYHQGGRHHVKCVWSDCRDWKTYALAQESRFILRASADTGSGDGS